VVWVLMAILDHRQCHHLTLSRQKGEYDFQVIMFVLYHFHAMARYWSKLKIFPILGCSSIAANVTCCYQTGYR